MLSRSLPPSASVGDNNYVHSLPTFANQENKQLSKKLKELEERKNTIAAFIDDNSERADAIISHMKNVQTETSHTQGLYDAKNRQIETEDHFKQLAERENGRIKSEMTRIGSEVTRISDYLNFLQSSIYRENDKIDAVRAEFKLESDELEEWLRVQQEKEEDNQALLKYSKEDDSKEKELSLAIEKLVGQVNKAKASLTAEVTETQVAQIELENTTEAFKQLHLARQDLIRKWEESVIMMKKRDDDIDKSQQNYIEKKMELRAMQNKVKERSEMHQQQLDINLDADKNIVLSERKVAKFREEESHANNSLQQFKDEVEVIKNTLSKSSSELRNKKSELANLQASLAERQSELEKSKSNYADLKKKLAELDDESVTLEARAEQLQEMLEKETTKNTNLDKKIKVLREAQFKQSQRLFKLRQEKKNLAAEIVGGEAATRNLKSKINKIDQEALKQRAMLYSMEFGVQQLERKIRRMEGDRTDEEKNELLGKIEVLNVKYESQMSKWTTLNEQLKRSQEATRLSKRNLQGLEKDKTELEKTIAELNLYNESAAHQLVSKVKEKENLMVEENIMRLELRRLRSFVHARSDEVLTLETRKLQLGLALEERAKEIEIHKVMLRVQIKNAEDERHSATSELRDRVGKVEKLKRRYEILMTQFAPEDGEQEHSQAFYVIKASQRREELQREGDELDSNIRRAEKEIKALENTLGLMNDRNELYRTNLYKQELDGNDLQHKELLDTEYQQIMSSFKKKRTVIQDLQLVLQDSERQFSEASAREADILQKLHIQQVKCEAAGREIDDAMVKYNRAVKFVENAAKAIRKKGGLESATLEEKDMLIRSLREVGSMSLRDLANLFLSKYPEMQGRVQGLMELLGLQVPSRSVSRVSSRASSLGSIQDYNASSPPSIRGSIVSPDNHEQLPPANGRSGNNGELSTISRTGSNKNLMNTTNINAAVVLPSVPLSRSSSRGSSSSRASVTSPITKPKSKPASIANSRASSQNSVRPPSNR